MRLPDPLPAPDALLATIGGTRAMGRMLERVRRDADLTPGQLATRIGRDTRLIRHLEAGKKSHPNVLLATQLAHACEASVALLVASFALPKDDPLPWPRKQWALPGARELQPAGADALGAAIREERLQRGWAQDDLGVLIGTDGSYVSAIEAGGPRRRPTFLTVIRFGYALAATTPERVAHAVFFARVYAGEVEGPPMRPARTVRMPSSRERAAWRRRQRQRRG